MATRSSERVMTVEEREQLQEIFDSNLDRVGRVRTALSMGGQAWVTGMFLFVILFWLVSWLVGVVSDLDISMDSSTGKRILLAAGLGFLGYVVVSSVRWINNIEHMQPLVRADLANSKVIVENLDFTAAKRMQEQEHGGLIYFLNTSDDRVFVFYDQESQDLGVQGEDPKSSSFIPRTMLTIVRAPESGLIIDRTFSGDDLDTEDTLDLMAAPDEWPGDEEFCDIPWDKLERQLSG